MKREELELASNASLCSAEGREGPCFPGAARVDETPQEQDGPCKKKTGAMSGRDLDMMKEKER